MATHTKCDYYEVLSVSRTATQQEIKSAFLKLAVEYQAAGKPANIEAVERFRQIARAYRALSDVELRRRYDELGESAIVGQRFSSGYDQERWLIVDSDTDTAEEAKKLADLISALVDFPFDSLR